MSELQQWLLSEYEDKVEGENDLQYVEHCKKCLEREGIDTTGWSARKIEDIWYDWMND